MKPNEARRKLDLPDGEGGDTLLANGSIVPLTMAGAAYQKGQIEQEETENRSNRRKKQSRTQSSRTQQDNRTKPTRQRTRKNRREVNNHGKEKTF